MTLYRFNHFQKQPFAVSATIFINFLGSDVSPGPLYSNSALSFVLSPFRSRLASFLIPTTTTSQTPSTTLSHTYPTLKHN